jgi:hypothetical protein
MGDENRVDADGSREGGAAADLVAELAKRGIALGPVIGRGAAAVVFRAQDTRHDRPLAVKVLSLDAADEGAAARFAREISAVARLRHPNILSLIDSGTTASGARYFLMPLVGGETLRARLDRGPLPMPMPNPVDCFSISARSADRPVIRTPSSPPRATASLRSSGPGGNTSRG